MKIIYISQEQENAKFAELAANEFKKNAKLYTFAESDPKPGKLMAIRWNPFTVLIIKLDEEYEPLAYPTSQFFQGDLPPLIGDFQPEVVISEPEKINKLLLGAAIELALQQIVEPPPRNCSCHISPPCCDCVDHASTREAIQKLKEAQEHLDTKDQEPR